MSDSENTTIPDPLRELQSHVGMIDASHDDLSGESKLAALDAIDAMPTARIEASEWAGLQKMPDDMLASLSYWLMIDYTPPGGRLQASIPQVKSLSVAILFEAERRGWPDGWWEDPSVIPGLEGGES